MHHYRCQNVNISTTASIRIVDTLELFPHNYQMPQLSSNDRLLMAAKNMMDALQNPHPDAPFASVGDDTMDTMDALADLAAIFKLKLRQARSPATQASPAKVVPRPSLVPSSTNILSSPMPIRRQTRSQTRIHTQDIPNVPLPPRVVTPRTLHPSPPRVPTGSQGLSPHNLSHDDFCGMDSTHMAIALRKKPLVTAAPSQRSHAPGHRKRNGILGSHEGSPSPTALDPRFWQRMRTPLPRNSRHPRNRYMFIYQTH
jgi:hypothetical protein